EVRRILRPGARFTVLWNNRENDRDPVVAWTREAVTRHVPGFTHAYRDSDWGAVLTSTGDFEGVAFDEARHAVPMDRERYLDLWRSHNRLNAAAGPERFAAFIADVEHHLERERVETVNVPYLCKAWTVRRR